MAENTNTTGSGSASGSNANGTDDGPVVDLVNPHVRAGVEASTMYSFGYGTEGSSPGTQLVAGSEIAYNKVAQAASYAVQDATDYQRNMMTVLSTVQGQAFAIMFADSSKIPEMTAILAAATEQMASVTASFTAVSLAASEAATKFPK